MRLIDADKVMRDAEHISAFRQGLADMSDLAIVLSGGNTIEAEPVRHGRWIPDSDKHAFSEECSVCGEGVLWDDGRLHHYNYCPHCGAKMESGTALSEAEPLAGCVDDADLEHMTRFAMQQAVNRK